MSSPLKLLSLDEVPRDFRREFVPAIHWISMGLLLAAAVGCVWVALEHNALGWWGAFWLGGFWLLLLHTALKTRHADAWLLRLGQGGVYIKWRSFQNVGHGRGGLQVVHIPFAQIASARSHKKRWATPSSPGGGNREVRHNFLELDLKQGADIEALKARLDDERSGRWRVGKSVWHHFPVSLEANHIVRVEWNARPGIDTLLDELRAAGVAIRHEHHSEADLTDASTDAGELHELARRGDVMALVRVLRLRDRTLDLTQAHARAKAMIAGQPEKLP